MMTQVANSTKKVLAASGVALGLAGLGMSFGVCTAAAEGTAPDTGTYDELLDIKRDGPQQLLTGSYGLNGADMGTYDALLNIVDADGFQAARP